MAKGRRLLALLMAVLICGAVGISGCNEKDDKNVKNEKALHDEANLSSSKSESAVREQAKTVLCIDPGHPSDGDDGLTVQHGLREADVTLQVGQRLASILEKKYGFQVILTRQDKETIVSNQARARKANEAQAALFFRLHCDSEPSEKRTGFAVYYPDRQGTVDGVTGPSTVVIEKSRVAAEAIHQELAEGMGEQLKDNGVRTDAQTYIGGKQGALTGSIYSQVPVALVEMVFLSNQRDAQFIGSPEGQERMADSLAKGIVKFLKTN
ncbi:N-acetylmuramoyl-L-alanine amidase family protein [Heliobacterium mobile]|nr:N-acetylmuramoyl-L-alanine amidase [Heliobacterium mobile]